MPKLGPDYFSDRTTLQIARDLLGKILVHEIDGQRLSGIIAETEAYLDDDPASHSYKGPTPRSTSLFLHPGTIYTYRSYGLHTCFNIATTKVGTGEAVLLRSIIPLEGRKIMDKNRGQVPRKQLTNGPGKLTQALGIQMTSNGRDLFSSDIWIEMAESIPDAAILITPRIGISQAKEQLYRFLIEPKFAATLSQSIDRHNPQDQGR